MWTWFKIDDMLLAISTGRIMEYVGACYMQDPHDYMLFLYRANWDDKPMLNA